MIKHIALKNFKCFEELDLNLAPLTLITGVNGMGKSSVIQSLLLLKQSYEMNYLSENKVELQSQDFINLESAEDVCYEMASTREVEIGLESENGENHNWKINASSFKEHILPFSYNGNGQYKSLSLFDKDFIYIDAERFGPRSEYFKSSARRYNTKIGVQGELAPSYLFNALSNDEQIPIGALKHKDASSLSVYENVSFWISEILGTNVKAKITEIDEKRVKLSYAVEGFKGREFSALQVGFGFSFSLPVILSILVAKPGDLLTIENPEAHLHPAAQSKIGKLIALAAQNGVQIILESHSDHLLNGIRVMAKGDKWGKIEPENVVIYFFNTTFAEGLNNRHKEILKIDSSGKLDDWPIGFFDEWENNLNKLIF